VGPPSTITYVDINGGSRSGSKSSHLILQDLQCDFRFDLFFSFSFVLVFVIFIILVLVFVNHLLFSCFTPFSFSFSLTKIILELPSTIIAVVCAGGPCQHADIVAYYMP